MNTRVETIFDAVVDLSSDERERYFAEQNIDPQLQAEVEALVAFDTNASTTLERQVARAAEDAIVRLDPKDTLCGPFRLGKLLGRGGMGAVYLGERIDGEVSQQVAIKLLRPGADDQQLRRRFRAERQILATLSHPGIARLYDAGHRDDGQPYLVMEYVQGEPIDAYTAKLSVRQKLALFLKVCSAISYLHRNLIVHRDLKPSNILVNAEGEPKLLDFGLAKMLDLTTDSTMTSMRMLTPDYASPEQVVGGAVTTATDIYSLGAVLYKLLTDECPHRFEGDSVAAIALTISAGKIVPPSKLAPVIKSDLEMIVMKALRREPHERYATIDQLSDDLENFLESRPIRARRGDAWYRTRIYVQRHWFPVTAAILIIASLATGLALANRERSIAQRRFLEVRQLANKLFDIDAEAGKLAGSTKTRELIVDTSLEYLRRLSADARKDPELAIEVANAYLRVARVQGVPTSSNLGQLDQAEQTLQIAQKFIASVLATHPDHRVALLYAAQIAHDRMLVARAEGHSKDALALARTAAEWLRKFHAQKGDEGVGQEVLATYLNVADQYMYGQQFDDALRISRAGIDVARVLNREYYVGALHWVSAEVFRRQGDLDNALIEIRESVKMLDPGTKNVELRRQLNFANALSKEGMILGEENAINLGRKEEAVEVFDRSFQISDSLAHQDARDQSSRGRLAGAGVYMADILRHSDPRRALALYDHMLRDLGQVSGSSSLRRYEVSALAGSSYILRDMGRAGEARQRLTLAFEKLQAIQDYPLDKLKPGSEAGEALMALADLESKSGEMAKAVEIDTQLLAKVEAYGPHQDTYLVDAVEMSRLYATLAELHHRAGHRDLEAQFAGQRMALWRQWDARLPHNDFIRRQISLAAAPEENNTHNLYPVCAGWCMEAEQKAEFESALLRLARGFWLAPLPKLVAQMEKNRGRK